MELLLLNFDFEHEPNWVISMLISGIVGALISSVSKIVKITKATYMYLFSHNHMEGKWFCYHWTCIEGWPRLVESQLEIRKGFSTKFKLNLLQSETTLNYIGEADLEGDHIVFQIKAKNHKEKTICRFNDIVPSIDYTVGIWLSYDHDKQVASGGILLSKIVRSKVDAAKLIRKRIRYDHDGTLMQVINRNRRNRT